MINSGNGKVLRSITDSIWLFCSMAQFQTQKVHGKRFSIMLQRQPNQETVEAWQWTMSLERISISRNIYCAGTRESQFNHKILAAWRNDKNVHLLMSDGDAMSDDFLQFRWKSKCQKCFCRNYSKNQKPNRVENVKQNIKTWYWSFAYLELKASVTVS